MTTTMATPAKQLTVIRFTEISGRRGARRTRPVYVEKLAYADDPGMQVKRMWWTSDREKAARFSSETARAIALQFCDKPAVLELADGTELVDATRELQAAQQARCASIRKVRAEFDQALLDGLRQACPDVLAALGRL